SWGVDWLTSTHFSDVGRVAEFACRLLGVEGGVENFEALPVGGRGYRLLMVGPAGVKLYAGPVVPAADGQSHVCLEMSGRVVSSIPPEVLQAEFVSLTWRWRPSRCDLRVDHSLFTNDDVRSAVAAGLEHGRFERRSIETRQSVEGPGDTVTFGSRSS